MHADKVVRVHNGVDEAVEHDSQVNVAVVASVHVYPVELRENKRGNKCGNGSELGTNEHNFGTADDEIIADNEIIGRRAGLVSATGHRRATLWHLSGILLILLLVKRGLIEKASSSSSSLVTIKLCA